MYTNTGLEKMSHVGLHLTWCMMRSKQVLSIDLHRRKYLWKLHSLLPRMYWKGTMGLSLHMDRQVLVKHTQWLELIVIKEMNRKYLKREV